MRALALALAAAALGAAAPAAGGPSVTLNGVNIDGATNQRFESCTVVIDAQGNVHIEAKGYAVRTSDAAAPPPATPPPATPSPAVPGAAVTPPQQPRVPVVAYEARAPRLTRRYFLATEQSVPDGTQYDVAIFINAQWIREVKSSDPQTVMEVTKYLRPGPNRIVLAATKRLSGGGDRKYNTKDIMLKIVIGEGNVGGDHVMIDNPLLEMTRNAAEIGDRTEEFVLEAR